jgi:CheY-like chemotaxis protein/anti-sigma regulatory factor (Ser/Thr protein kinase)
VSLPSTSATSALPADESRPTRALVVDDERMNRDVIVAGLRVAGYETATAEDGQAAWEALDADPGGFDVILLDRRMPRMDGMALMAKLKADERLRDIPVIMQTAFAAPEDVVDGLQAGVYYYLAKPLDRRLLLSVVAAAVADRLRFRRLQRDLDRRTTALGLMAEGNFAFRTLDEGNTLAVALARACPRSRFMVVGLSEIFTNAIEHGNLGIGSAEKERLIADKRWASEIEARLDAPQNRGKAVRVEFRRRADEVRITVRDDGGGFDWRSYVDLDPQRAFAAHGRGIAMARRLCFDSVEYHDPGNEVVLTIRGDTPQPVAVEGGARAVPPPPPPRLANADDLRLARAMQKDLLPRAELLGRIAAGTGLVVTGFHEFSSDLGGDLWGIAALDDHRVALWLADFSGHGVTAALNTFRLHALVDGLGAVQGRPALFLAELNRRLAGALPVGQYATMLYGVVDAAAGVFTYAAAAAPAPVAMPPGARAPESGDGSGLPLGINRGTVYPERRLTLAPGGVLFLASDALAESPQEGGHRLGTAGVAELVRQGVAARGTACDVHTLLAPVLATMARPLPDDLTAICCVRPG